MHGHALDVVWDGTAWDMGKGGSWQGWESVGRGKQAALGRYCAPSFKPPQSFSDDTISCFWDHHGIMPSTHAPMNDGGHNCGLFAGRGPRCTTT
jgi:hypothetical protein